ncbi:MAG: hypothetical protein KDD42_09420, partial [Bdellovibrionales bacterium]|nr:hypothetical protein [Bdellovibrionales bacterium]
ASPLDNCPNLSNPDQLNSDGDDFGDACDPDPLHAPTPTPTSTPQPTFTPATPPSVAPTQVPSITPRPTTTPRFTPNNPEDEEDPNDDDNSDADDSEDDKISNFELEASYDPVSHKLKLSIFLDSLSLERCSANISANFGTEGHSLKLAQIKLVNEETEFSVGPFARPPSSNISVSITAFVKCGNENLGSSTTDVEIEGDSNSKNTLSPQAWLKRVKKGMRKFAAGKSKKRR